MKKTKLDSESINPPLGWVGEAPKILVIQQKMIGDVLVSSLICENLKLNYPEAKIHYLVNRFTMPVIENNPFIDEVVVFEDKYRSSKLQFYKFLKGINKANYDVVIDAYGKLESNLITLFSGAKKRISWNKNYSRFIYTDVIKTKNKSESTAGLAIENRLKLLKSLKMGLSIRNRPKIYLTDNEIDDAKCKLSNSKIDNSRPLYMISILGSGIIKSYPSDYMAKVLDHIVDFKNAQLILNFMPSQELEAKAIYNQCKSITKKNIHFDIKANNLREFIALTSQCDALIGNEGGAVNMAKAINIPTFTIFSPWIDKETWSSFEDGINNVSVHLDELKPEYYENKAYKKLKHLSLDLYEELDPEFVIKKLNDFLVQH